MGLRCEGTWAIFKSVTLVQTNASLFIIFVVFFKLFLKVISANKFSYRSTIYLVSELWVKEVKDPGLLNPIQIQLCGLMDHCKLCHNRTTACQGWYNVTELYYFIIINLFSIQCGGSLKSFSILRMAARPRRAAPRTSHHTFLSTFYFNWFFILFLYRVDRKLGIRIILLNIFIEFDQISY